MLGNPVPCKYNITNVAFISSYNEKTVSRLENNYKLKKEEGSLTVSLTGMPLGNFWLEVVYQTGGVTKINS